MPDEMENPQDLLTMTVRLHDPKEKVNHEMAASWGVIKVAREDLGLTYDQFWEKYVKPALQQVINHRLK